MFVSTGANSRLDRPDGQKLPPEGSLAVMGVAVLDLYQHDVDRNNPLLINHHPALRSPAQHGHAFNWSQSSRADVLANRPGVRSGAACLANRSTREERPTSRTHLRRDN